ncbi:UDP-2,3-diacylglucosamine diphosphatase LpxI [Roseobacter sp. HKCCD9010]|uniref:LpxI family protein n=1 Tax=unclassified Roseobacter TaxID=196798 RepID=UPI001491039B|nr:MULTISPECIES: UDP-2,3-diacylglucosamine diphosphatase LpxI [unclassified Roseobacter]MBF9050544.1 UDP-2,3-diacylglucosamine diphosphatase LpxI [Rhodobacterales bacterium HKCCD4356]NNV12039.1 UDP-2,3-diacylglucosamine diphosphatase LpxI [Roseobacter sp. HKCCD7357]NNV17053.1 UDP-2,3-diacylglucosamine diphosphatase LpxI [Roseobacter sp. HKCCD8768]NNV26282.1 UDP-2,3-diacylglucosamine diphosphatase LpxI [Roseobacter sp. HKCCD8192]NNV30777.1 UDP-2,3-diacylglucosamine diphosphatase LpxI [Roseobact
MARAIIAGSGALPQLLLQAGSAHVVAFQGVELQVRDAPVIPARFEQLGGLFEALRAQGVDELCLAGAMTRPQFDPSALDETTIALLPRLMAAIGQGDDGLLRSVIELLEDEGFAVRAAHELRPDLVAEEGVLAGIPTSQHQTDATRARAVLDALGPLDVGQGAVAASGQVLGIETLQGTDAMLDFVAQTRPGSGGVFVKRPKPGQDLRVDMPAIGADTVRLAAKAGLSGIEIAAGSVLLLDRGAVLTEAEAKGVAIWAAP